MACSGAHCTNHSTGTTTCSGHRPANSSVSPVVSAPTQGQIVTAAKINELRNAIITEINRWNDHAHYTSVSSNANWTNVNNNISQGVIIDDDATIDTEDDALVFVGGPGAPGTYNYTTATSPDVVPPLTNNLFSPGVAISPSSYSTILSSYNTLKADCICNTDCACNAVCACHNDCGCNYSDLRLKMEIIYC